MERKIKAWVKRDEIGKQNTYLCTEEPIYCGKCGRHENSFMDELRIEDIGLAPGECREIILTISAEIEVNNG